MNEGGDNNKRKVGVVVVVEAKEVGPTCRLCAAQSHHRFLLPLSPLQHLTLLLLFA